MKARFTKVLLALVFALAASTGVAQVLSASDSGIWTSEQTEFQGFVMQYAPVDDPSMVVYWFTYDELGSQAWLVSENLSLADTLLGD